jgi:heat-inducible transcriptional repressor
VRQLESVQADLSDRERRILQALIDEYISTASPVGSKALVELTDLSVSPATVRNVLAALAEQGLIDQPHTSAGRVPTDRGLRYYVDSLLELQQPSAEVHDQISARIGEASEVQESLREASRVLSRLSRQTSLVIALQPDSAPIQHVELVRLRDDAVLLIVVTAEGKVQNRLLDWSKPLGGGQDAGHIREPAPTRAELVLLSERLSGLLIGSTFEEGQQTIATMLADARAELSRVEKRVLTITHGGLSASDAADVHVEGTAHLLQGPADQEAVRRTQELLSFLDEHDRLKNVLARAIEAPGVRVFIGEENPAAQLIERGVVTAPISGGSGQRLGMLGVIGPRHLDYARVVPLVDLTARVVARVLVGS